MERDAVPGDKIVAKKFLILCLIAVAIGAAAGFAVPADKVDSASIAATIPA
jgi:hypothetical protein